MSSRIKLLPDSVANQIAAGEVVNRPASVVKELVENAVDAGAKNVTVNFRAGGGELIQIKDDGSGMTPQEARMAFERHATSKIAAVDDIYKLHTFGFRGEALASIAAVAEVEMQTRTEDEEVGSRLFIDGGTFRDQRPAAASRGTQIFVRNLFYNVPARKKFLDKATNEAAHVLTEFARAALAHPEVGFKLFRDDAPVYDLPAGSLRERVVGVAGKTLGARLLEVSVDTSLGRLRGFVGAPDAARKRMREQFLFVNGRFFKSVFFHKAVLRAFEKIVPFGVQPPYFLYLEVDPEQIDVNVHPQKTEVKFSDQAALWQIINAAVRETLAKNGAVPMMDFDEGERVEIPVLGPSGGYDFGVREPAVVRSGSGYNPFSQYPNEVDPAFGGGAETAPDAEFPSGLSGEAFGGLSGGLSGEAFGGLSGGLSDFSDVELIESEAGFTSVVQLGEGYAAARWGGRFVAVDLRRAREAVMFDRLETMVGAGRSATQQLLFPERMAFSADDFSLLRDNLDEFSAFGFELRPAGEHAVEIAGVPPDVALETVDEVIYGMLDALRDGLGEGGGSDTKPGSAGGGAQQAQQARQGATQKLAAAMARSAASAASVSGLTAAETEALLGALAGVRNPSFTPGGRPVMAEITTEEIKNKLR